MRRRSGTRLGAAALAATFVVAGALVSAPAAQAADAAEVTTPAEGSVVRDRVTLTVQLPGPATKVDVRVSQDGTSMASGTTSVPLPCIEGCDDDGRTVWGSRTFDPTAGAPFSPAGQCNGLWYVQPRVDGGAWGRGSLVTFSAPPAAPTGVKVQLVDDVAQVTWRPSAGRDVVLHRLERSTGGGPFVEIAELSPSADRYADGTVSQGTHQYRVVAARPDGFVNAQAVAACSDKGADLETPSQPATLVWNKDGSSSSGDGQGTSSSGGTSSGEGSSSGAGSGTTSPAGSNGTPAPSGSAAPSTDPDSPPADPDAPPSASASPRPSGSARPVPPPPSARRQTSSGLDVPALGGSNAADDTYFGEDDGYSDTIDYSQAPVIAGEEFVGFDANGDPVYETIRQPGEVVAFGVLTIDTSKVRTIALGLLLVVLALHARRWMSAAT